MQWQRENQSKNMKDVIKERALETEHAKKKRKEENAARMKKMREKFSSESLEDIRQILRIKEQIGTENGDEASWIRKA